MSIEILSIGSELLSGKTVNQNAATIARLLLREGYVVSRVTTVPDVFHVLRDSIEEIVKRADFVITTGGLGPTEDDKTRGVVADLVGRPLVTDEAILAALKEKYGEKEAILRNQAALPEGAKRLVNELGTATGFAVEIGESLLIALPGVPTEMEAMLVKQAFLFVKKRELKRRVCFSLFFCLRREFEFDAALSQLQKKYPFIEIGICPSYENVSIYLTAEIEKKKELKRAEDEVICLFPTFFFSNQSSKIEEALKEELVKKEKTVAVAESCTGGKVGARLTQLPGISSVFLGGVIAYSNEVKKTVLGVSEATLADHGAVSEETVIEMGSSALKQTGADYALVTSGVAGPDGGTPEKPVGTVWVAMSKKGEKGWTHCCHFPAKRGRSVIIDCVATYLFASLWRYLKHGKAPFEDSP